MKAGARLKRIRRLGTPLPGLTRKEPKGAGTPQRGGRRRLSNYRIRLEEKQKVRLHYGVSERQLRTIFAHASNAPGSTGDNLLMLLERRLDSVAFRVGFAPTIRAARQLVAHGHIQVNGKRVDRSGYRVEPGDVIAVAERAREIPDVVTAVERGPEVRLPSFLRLDDNEPFQGVVVAPPDRSDVPFIVSESAIVEFYAR